VRRYGLADGGLSKKVKELLAVRTQAVAAKRALTPGEIICGARPVPHTTYYGTAIPTLAQGINFDVSEEKFQGVVK
jgi:hypothetical protein